MIKRTRRLFATLPVLFMVVSLSYGSYSLVQASESDISENVLESISESTEEDDEVSEVASESESSDAGVSAKESEESTEEEASDALDMMTEIDSSEDTYDMNEELTIEDGALDYETPAYLLNPRDISLYPTEYEGVTIKHIEGEYMNGFHMIPDEKLYKGTIVVFGGSEGSPSYDLAVGFASAGYEVFSMFFFGMENQQAELAEVPLDFFQEILDYKVEQGGNLQEPLTVYGASKGAELALNLGVNYDEIDHLVLMAPSAYNFFGLNMAEEDLGSWTYEGETLPYLSVMNATNEARQSFIETMTAGEPIAYADVYESMITNTDESELEATRIKVEEFKGDLLIFAGDDDQMWPSALMAEVISEYTVNEADVNIFENAGHVFYGNGTMEMPGYGVILMGGDEQNNEKTLQIYFEKLIQTVNRWHSENE